MFLHTDKKVFNELVTATANDIGLANFQVEKDYYVSLFLKELSKHNEVSIVFKGGTSLSKCYDVIHRFSEDIDLAIQFPNIKAGDGLRKRLKQAIKQTIGSLGMTFLNETKVQSDLDFNIYEVEYEKAFPNTSPMIQHILVETIVVYQPYPCENLKVGNYITKYLTKEGREDLIKKYQLESFEMITQTIERTFIDKLFALCDYHLERIYDRHSRHLYDIHRIWVSKKLNMDLMREKIPYIIRDRQLFGIANFSCQPGAKPNQILEEIIASNAYKQDYDSVTTLFIYKPVDYLECIQSLREIIGLKVLPNIIPKHI